MNTSLTPPLPDDARLVQLHLAGDAAAFKQIVERYQGMVCALAYSAAGDVARSEDIAQDVFVAAWKQLPQLREPAKLRGWLGGITRNLAHNALRQATRTPTARSDELPPDLPAEGSDPRQSTIAADEAGLMWTALGQLPEIYREPMVMFYRGGRSMAAVAEALEISEETVRQRLTRGRAMLTERMAKLVEEALERSAPTTAFTGMVLLALPGPLAPALFEAAGGGSAATKTLATAGAVGSAAAKGGVIIKFLSALAFLPALVNGLQDFASFGARNAGQADVIVQRKTAWAYLRLNIGLGVFLMAFLVVPHLVRPNQLPLVYVSTILAAAVGIWIAVGAKAKVEREMPPVGCDQKSTEPFRGYEYCSSRKLFGLPLHHVRLGTQSPRQAPAVKAWLAVSDGTAIGGLFAIGPVAVAPISFGLLSVGVLGIGLLTLGMGALGVVAAGWWSQAWLAFGGFSAKGVVTLAPQFASGLAFWAVHAGDAATKTFFQEHWFYRAVAFFIQSLIWGGMFGWVIPVIMTGWQLWRTRTSR